MADCNAGLDRASPNASSRRATERSTGSSSARRRRASGLNEPISVSARRPVAIVRARVHSPAA
jgi:hypothetical protein